MNFKVAQLDGTKKEGLTKRVKFTNSKMKTFDYKMLLIIRNAKCKLKLTYFTGLNLKNKLNKIKFYKS